MSTETSPCSSSSTYLSNLSPPIIQQLERVFIDDEENQNSNIQINIADMNISSQTEEMNDVSLIERIEKLESLLGKLITENRTMKDKLKKNDVDKFNIWNRLHYCENDINLLNQYSRRENIEISGIPSEIQNNNLEKYVIDLLRNIGVHGLTSYEISACHCLKKSRSSQKQANVIVRFINRKRAYESLDKFHYTKNKYPNDYRKISIFENLCPTFKKIFNKSRKLMFNGKIKNTWSYKGLIFIQKNNSLFPTKLTHFHDLEELFPEVTY